MKPSDIRPALALAVTLLAFPVQPCHAQSIPQQLNYQGRVTVQGVNFNGTGQFKFALVGAGVNLNQTATANATTTGGGVQISLMTFGSGYTVAPEVTITNGAGSNGTGATATATLGLGPGTGTGPVDSVYLITVTNSGSGYTSAVVTIAPPPPNVHSPVYWSNDASTGDVPASAVSLPVTNGLYSVSLGDTTLAHMTAALSTSIFQNPDVRLRVWFDDGLHGFQQLSPDQKLNTAPYAFRAALAQAVPSGAITSAQLADGAVETSKIAAGALTPTQLFTSSGPQTGQVLSFDGTKFNWVTAAGGGGGGSLTLPFSGMASGAFGGSIFHVSGTTPVSGYGIEGESQNGPGIFGHSPNSDGVLGQSSGYYGVRGETTAENQSGVYGYSSANGSAGVAGSSNGNGPAMRALSLFGGGAGLSVSSLSNDGIDATTSVVNKSAVFAHTSAANAYGVYAFSGQYTAMAAKTESAGQTAGFFWNSAGGDAIRTTGKVDVGGVMEVHGNATIHGTATVRVLTIDNGIDVAEPFMTKKDEEFPSGSVMVISDEREGELQLSQREYDTRVAGIISGANGINPGLQLTQKGYNDVGGQPVALTGRVYVKADASNGAIKPGDLLTTSANPGHAMKATDHSRTQGAVLGKAMSALDEGSGYVLALVTLQ